jgi:hypothetical protein
MSKTDVSRRTNMRYGTGRPRQIPAGRVLAHNHVQHGADWACGPNGFRWWTWRREKKPRDFLRCDCGWMGLPHFAYRDHAKRFKCDTVKDGCPEFRIRHQKGAGSPKGSRP